MFNSPLHYCKVCKQYVALDRSVKECARKHGCNVESCAYVDLFCPPPASQDEKPTTQDKPIKP